MNGTPWVHGWSNECTCSNCERLQEIEEDKVYNAKMVVTSIFLVGCMLIGGCLNGQTSHGGIQTAKGLSWTTKA